MIDFLRAIDPNVDVQLVPNGASRPVESWPNGKELAAFWKQHESTEPKDVDLMRMLSPLSGAEIFQLCSALRGASTKEAFHQSLSWLLLRFADARKMMELKSAATNTILCVARALQPTYVQRPSDLQQHLIVAPPMAFLTFLVYIVPEEFWVRETAAGFLSLIQALPALAGDDLNFQGSCVALVQGYYVTHPTPVWPTKAAMAYLTRLLQTSLLRPMAGPVLRAVLENSMPNAEFGRQGQSKEEKLELGEWICGLVNGASFHPNARVELILSLLMNFPFVHEEAVELVLTKCLTPPTRLTAFKYFEQHQNQRQADMNRRTMELKRDVMHLNRKADEVAKPGEPTCNLCLTNECIIALAPCGHRNCCRSCATRMLAKTAISHCPWCRAVVTNAMEVQVEKPESAAAAAASDEPMATATEEQSE